MRRATFARRFILVGLGAGGALAGVTALRLKIAGSGASSPADDTAAAAPVDPVPNLAVTGLSEAELRPRGIMRSRLGELTVPTGRIVAADPLVQPEREAFLRPVPPGRYPVLLYVARERVALAELRLADDEPVRWAMAVMPGQDPGTLKPDEIFGYPVDAGLGAFMDTAGRDALLAREAQEAARIGKDFNAYDDLLKAPMERAGDRELLYQPIEGDGINVALFQSGWGDGFYASYWGLDATDRPLRLVTDFGVLEKGDGRPPATQAP